MKLVMTANKKKDQILSLLEYCTDSQKMMFIRMYSPDDLYNRSFKDIVHSMPHRKLDHALLQLENTIVKNAKDFTI